MEIFPHFIGIYFFIYFLDQTAEEQLDASLFGDYPLFVCQFGVPDSLHTDQGKNFDSMLIKEVCRLLGIDETRTTAYHPQLDGLE